jgi:lipopolysaccharide/colanic/teichoic acid biosynthesis glycosyltransferase
MYEAWGKRALDIVLSALLLAMLLPVMAGVAVAVWRCLGRPVLFVQRRAGRAGRPFPLPKFRSMRPGDAPDGERLTPFGRRLRASGLDELPQLLCVLRGQMSLIGPRPLPPRYLLHYSPRQAIRLRVRPGLLGPGVAAGRNAVPWTTRLELEAAYAARRATLRDDLRVATASVKVWLSGQGAEAPGHDTMPPFTEE